MAGKLRKKILMAAAGLLGAAVLAAASIAFQFTLLVGILAGLMSYGDWQEAHNPKTVAIEEESGETVYYAKYEWYSRHRQASVEGFDYMSTGSIWGTDRRGYERIVVSGESFSADITDFLKENVPLVKKGFYEFDVDCNTRLIFTGIYFYYSKDRQKFKWPRIYFYILERQEEP